jgi:hypothetical protein
MEPTERWYATREHDFEPRGHKLEMNWGKDGCVSLKTEQEVLTESNLSVSMDSIPTPILRACRGVG